MPIVNQITLPQDVLDRVERVLEYHESTKHTYDSKCRADPIKPDPQNQPYEISRF